MNPKDRESEIRQLLFRASCSELSAAMDRLAASALSAAEGLERFMAAINKATGNDPEWPEVVLEDILDAEVIGE